MTAELSYFNINGLIIGGMTSKFHNFFHISDMVDFYDYDISCLSNVNYFILLGKVFGRTSDTFACLFQPTVGRKTGLNASSTLLHKS